IAYVTVEIFSFSSRRRHTRFSRDWSSDVCSSDLWQVEFRTDPAKGQAVQGMTLRIEEFLPERLKLDLSTSSAGEALAPGKPLQLRAEAAYLYGAPAAGNRFTARMALAVAREPVVG